MTIHIWSDYMILSAIMKCFSNSYWLLTEGNSPRTFHFSDSESITEVEVTILQIICLCESIVESFINENIFILRLLWILNFKYTNSNIDDDESQLDVFVDSGHFVGVKLKWSVESILKIVFIESI